MILVAHPFGNANVRALLLALHEAGMLERYVTTLGFSDETPLLQMLPAGLRRMAARRGYSLPAAKIEAHPLRELVRLGGSGAGLRALTRHEHGWASVDRVWQELDAAAARSVRKCRPRVAYGYEDCALQLFGAAREVESRCAYELPIAYWETAQQLLDEEAQRWPEWEPTLIGTRDSPEKLARKTRELELAELVICPSDFVLESLPGWAREGKRCVVAAFGSPSDGSDGSDQSDRSDRSDHRPLRVLFAGAMSQRKGLADLFAAMKLLPRSDIELVVMGSPLRPLAWYRQQWPHFTYEPPRPHAEVLQLMRTCDVLVLPSIVEGRALVQQEAMACGLPLIATRNAGGADLIIEGETGFLVPIRSPEALAEKIGWCAEHRERICGMGIAAQSRAAELTWRDYGERILAALRDLT